MHVKANGKQVVDMTLTLGLYGAWTAMLQADASEAIASQVTLSIADTLEFIGTPDPTRSAEFLGRARLRLIGGAGGLDTAIGGKTYYQAPLSAILEDLLALGGETLSESSSSSLLATKPKHWARAAGTVRGELDVLADRFGFSWRILPDGKLWAGEEDWPTSPLTSYTLMTDAREEGRVELAAEVPLVLPGETFLGRHVEEVIHTLSKATLRTEVRFAT